MGEQHYINGWLAFYTEFILEQGFWEDTYD
jgi:hypothetical protein